MGQPQLQAGTTEVQGEMNRMAGMQRSKKEQSDQGRPARRQPLPLSCSVRLTKGMFHS